MGPPRGDCSTKMASNQSRYGLAWARRSTPSHPHCPCPVVCNDVVLSPQAVVRPMCNDLYDRHASDPITKCDCSIRYMSIQHTLSLSRCCRPWFPPSSTWNQRTAEQVKENVFTFFSAVHTLVNLISDRNKIFSSCLLPLYSAASIGHWWATRVQGQRHGHGTCQDGRAEAHHRGLP